MMNEWISVKDGLPELDTNNVDLFGRPCITVLALTDDKHIQEARYYSGGVWACMNTVTHWMPLPELPKEDAK